MVLLLLTGTSLPAFSFARQGNWRWRNDDGTDVTATWKAAENTPFTLTHRDNIRLRVKMFNVSDEHGPMGPNQVGLGYSYDGGINWSPITNDPGSNHFVYAASTHFTNQSPSTQLLSPLPLYSFTTGSMFDTYSTTNQYPSLPASTETELEFCIRATNEALDATVYDFRIIVGETEQVQTIALDTVSTTLTTAFGAAQVPLSLWGLIFAGLLIISGSVLIVKRF